MVGAAPQLDQDQGHPDPYPLEHLGSLGIARLAPLADRRPRLSSLERFPSYQEVLGASLRVRQIQDLHFHDLRHTFATRLQGLGHDYEVRQALLGHRMPGMTASYSHGGPAWDQKLRKAVTKLDSAFKLSYGLSYERPAVAVAGLEGFEFIGEPAGTRTQGPRLKRANQTVRISSDRE